MLREGSQEWKITNLYQRKQSEHKVIPKEGSEDLSSEHWLQSHNRENLLTTAGVTALMDVFYTNGKMSLSGFNIQLQKDADVSKS